MHLFAHHVQELALHAHCQPPPLSLVTLVECLSLT
jgi:hypothetical protein